MLALIALATAAQSAPAALPGVWEGTVGTLPVRACFVQREWGIFGAYYYMSRKRIIGLEAVEGAAASFAEGSGEVPGGPRWQIQSAAGNQLQARWTGGGRALPVRMTRVSLTGEDGESPCTSMAFHAPRLAGVRTVTSPATADGVRYTRITLEPGEHLNATVETFALAGDGEAARRINAALGRPLAGTPPEWFDCLRAPLETGTIDGDLNETYAPAIISQRWLSVNHQYDASCGGAHPSSGLVYETYDLTTGAEVDLRDWFTDAAVHRERVEGSEDELKTLLPALREIILAGWTGEGECGEVVREAEFWDVGLRRDAFVFSPSLPHVAQACGEEYVIPFARLRPLLNRDGTANVDALASERSP